MCIRDRAEAGLFDKLVKVKYEIPNDKPEMFGEYNKELDDMCCLLYTSVWRLRARHRLGHTRNACRAVWRRRMVGRFSGRRVGCLLRLCTRPFRDLYKRQAQRWFGV